MPDLLVHPLNYNPTNGEEMRLLNPGYPGGEFSIPDELFQDLGHGSDRNTWNWTFKTVEVTPGADRVEETEIDYNGPVAPDPFTCVTTWSWFRPRGPRCAETTPASPTTPGSACSTARLLDARRARRDARPATRFRRPRACSIRPAA